MPYPLCYPSVPILHSVFSLWLSCVQRELPNIYFLRGGGVHIWLCSRSTPGSVGWPRRGSGFESGSQYMKGKCLYLPWPAFSFSLSRGNTLPRSLLPSLFFWFWPTPGCARRYHSCWDSDEPYMMLCLSTYNVQIWVSTVWKASSLPVVLSAAPLFLFLNNVCRSVVFSR